MKIPRRNGPTQPGHAQCRRRVFLSYCRQTVRPNSDGLAKGDRASGDAGKAARPPKKQDHMTQARTDLSSAIAAMVKADGVKETIQALREELGQVEPMTPYTKEAGEELCDRMALGETLENVCKDTHMPNRKSVLKWRQLHADFDLAYMRARVDQMHAWSDQIITLADGAEGGFGKVRVPLDSDKLECIQSDGEIIFVYTRKHVTEAALQIDTRKWLMARLAPEDFGDKLAVSHAHSYEDKDDGELMQELRMAAEKAGMTPEQVMGLLSAEGVVQ